MLPLPVYILHAAAISKHFGTSILFGMKGQSVPCCLNLINYNWKVHAIVSMQDNMHAGLYSYTYYNIVRSGNEYYTI